MKKRLRAVIGAALIICMAAGLSGCATYNNFKAAFFTDENEDPEEATIRIAVYESTSGQNSEQGKAEVMGIELAHDLYGEVLGRTVELIYGNNQSSMYTGEVVIQDLIAQSPSVILGSCGETVTLAASSYVKAACIPAITISSTNPLITDNNEFYFSATFVETRQGDALADFAYTNQRKEKAAVVSISTDYAATETIKRFTNRLKKLTDNESCVAGSYTLPADTTDYTDTIESIRESEADVVFLAISAANAQTFLEQAEEQELTDVLFLGTRAWNDDSLIEFIREHEALDVAWPSDFSQEVTTDMSAVFLDAYHEKYGEEAEPSEATAIAFDAYLLALQAIEEAYDAVMDTTAEDLAEAYESEASLRAATEDLINTKETGIPSGRQIREALASITEFEGASGVISYNGGNEASKTISINHVHGDEEFPVYMAN